MSGGTCGLNTSVCNGENLLPVELRTPALVVVLGCRGCRSSVLYASANVVERRRVETPVARDRRRFVPVWLRLAAAKDFTGRAFE